MTKFVSRRCSYWKTRLDQKKGRRHTTRRSSRANSWLGHRNPTFPVPADTTIKGNNNIYALLGGYPLLSLQLSVDLAKMPLPSDERFCVPRTHIYVSVLLPLLCPHTYLPPPKTIHEQSPDPNHQIHLPIRIIKWSIFCLEDVTDCLTVQCVGSQSIHCFY